MTKTELKTFRRALESRQAELEAIIGNREALAVQTASDELDRIQFANERDCAMTHLEQNFRRWREVGAALQRITAGTFGICGACEAELSPKRLAVVPWAALCVVCQEAADREEKTPWSESEEAIVKAA